MAPGEGYGRCWKRGPEAVGSAAPAVPFVTGPRSRPLDQVPLRAARTENRLVSKAFEHHIVIYSYVVTYNHLKFSMAPSNVKKPMKRKHALPGNV